MSKTKLLLAQETNFSVVFKEEKKTHKKLPENFSYFRKRDWQEKNVILFYTLTSTETVFDHLNATVVWIFRTCASQFLFICLLNLMNIQHI